MIQLGEDWCESLADICKVHDPSAIVSNVTFHRDSHGKRMAVKTRAFMVCGYIGKPMRSFEAEFLEYLHNIICWLPVVQRRHILMPEPDDVHFSCFSRTQITT